jgi:uncharacterized protein (TIGR00725 family)
MTTRRVVIGVMGRGEQARPEDLRRAEELGEQIARQGWVLLTGGRNAGVMAAASRGAKRVPGSVTVGVLPSSGGADADVSPDIDVAIFTGMGDARDVVNVLSSDVVVICGALSAGTAAEAALALKSKRKLILLDPTPEAAAFFASLDASVPVACTPEDVVSLIRAS